MSSTIPLPPREQLCNRYCSNKYIHTVTYILGQEDDGKHNKKDADAAGHGRGDKNPKPSKVQSRAWMVKPTPLQQVEIEALKQLRETYRDPHDIVEKIRQYLATNDKLREDTKSVLQKVWREIYCMQTFCIMRFRYQETCPGNSTAFGSRRAVE